MGAHFQEKSKNVCFLACSIEQHIASISKGNFRELFTSKHV